MDAQIRGASLRKIKTVLDLRKRMLTQTNSLEVLALADIMQCCIESDQCLVKELLKFIDCVLDSIDNARHSFLFSVKRAD